MKIYVDIDETICFYKNKRDYRLAQPIPSNIGKINDLYEDGHEIVYWTARGTTTDIDWEKLTREQLERWGAKYTELKLGKPDYDIFICDKAVNSKRYFNEK